MTTWSGAALSAAMVLVAVCAVAAPAVAEPATTREKPQAQATDVSAHRRTHHYRHYAYRPYPTYYGRPVDLRAGAVPPDSATVGLWLGMVVKLNAAHIENPFASSTIASAPALRSLAISR